MIINTGNRTDIPAFYSRWFCNRIRAGYVMVRNPYNQRLVYKYRLDPGVVDLLCFCTKNPAPMLQRLGELRAFRQFWFVSVTPYGRDIEPGLPDKRAVLLSLKRLSDLVGAQAVGVRYDPIIINERYDADFHMRAFERLLGNIHDSVSSVVFSFVDLYRKTIRNLPGIRAVSPREQAALSKAMAQVCASYNLPLRACLEDAALARYGVDVGGCMTAEILGQAIGQRLTPPRSARRARQGCDCLLGCDIGAYNTCPHGCRYCYANSAGSAARNSLALHDPASPLLIGRLQSTDQIREPAQCSYICS